MAKFKSYEKYVYSDYFKAELPAEWMEKRLSYISAYDRNSFVDGPFGSDLKSSDYKESGVPLIQLNNIKDGKHVLQNYKFITEKKRVELSRHVALPNDIVIAKMAEPVARSAIVSDKYPEYVIVADCVKLSPDLSLINLSFLNWAINSDLVKMNAELVSSGTTRIRISLGELKKLKIPYPSLIEQQAIANFLDYETAQIDTLIEKQQTLIQLLKEKRQAVISHAVTKGLNPDAPMKDSGVEWLGEVPEHWTVCALKHILATPITDGPHETPIFLDEGVPFISAEAVSQGYINFDKKRAHISKLDNEKYSKKYTPKKYDIYIVKSGATTGVSAIVETDREFNIWSPLAVIRCAPYCEPYFTLFAIRSKYFQEEIRLNWNYGTQQNIGMAVLGNLLITYPPRKEAQEISNYLKRVTEKMNELIERAEQAIHLMQERRTALISAAVTGKIDVRGWEKDQ